MRKIIVIKLYGNRNQAMLHIYISSENFINQLIKNTYMSRLRPSTVIIQATFIQIFSKENFMHPWPSIG